MTRYQPNLLFTVAAYHSYFASGLCPALTFHPGVNTLSLQKRFALPLFESKNGFHFYQGSDMQVSSYLDYLQHTTGINYFDFSISTTTDYFYQYTDFPPVWKGKLEYNSKDTVSPGDGTLLLKQHLSAEENTPVAGTIRIWFTDLMALHEQGTVPQYQLKFTARSSQWQYYFINDSGVTFNNPAVTGDQGFEFEGPEPVTIPNGTSAQRFTSGRKLLPLSERPGFRFSLVNRTNQQAGRNKTIIKRLPCADPASFNMVKTGDEWQYTSPIYVFI